MKEPRILIVRLSAFGDCVLTTPLLCAARRMFPTAHIAWLTQTNCAPVIEGHPCLDEVIRTPRGYLRSRQEVMSLRATLRAGRFDIAIDPQGLLKSSVAAWLSGARRRIGFARPFGREGSTLLNNVRVRPKRLHIVERQRELLSPLGDVTGDAEFQIPVDAQAEGKIEAWCAEQRLDAFCVFNPGAAWPSKCWPLDRYAEVATRIVERTGTPTVISWGGRQERDWAKQLAEMAPQAVRMAPPTDLRELASLLRRASLAVGSDTGPLHLAAAVGRPCVGIYGPTRPEFSRPFGPGHILLQKKFQEGSARERRTADNHVICMITAEEVTNACCDILGRTSRAVA